MPIGSKYPGELGGPNSFKNDLRPFLRGPFPACPVGNKNDNINVYQTGNPLAASGGQGWAYDNVSGEFIIKHSSYSSLWFRQSATIPDVTVCPIAMIGARLARDSLSRNQFASGALRGKF